MSVFFQTLQHRTVSLLLICIFGLALNRSRACADDSKAAKPRTLAESREVGRKQSRFLQQASSKITESNTSNLQAFQHKIQPILEATCYPCHDRDSAEGAICLEGLNPDLLNGNDVDIWLQVQAAVTKREMPPEKEVAFDVADRTELLDWLSREIQFASSNRQGLDERTSFRRMTRYELNYALQDLLGLPYNFAKDLPPEASSKDGFQNSAELLQMSVSQLETYRQLIRKALKRATVYGPPPPVRHWGVTMEEAGRIEWSAQGANIEKERLNNSDDDPETRQQKLAALERELSKTHPVPYFKDRVTGRTVRAAWQYYDAKHANRALDSKRDIPDTLNHVAILPNGQHDRFTVELGDQIPDEGIMRVRVRASRANVDSGIPTLQLLFGWQASNEGRALVRVPDGERPITALPGKPEFYQWDVPLGEIYPRNSVRKTSTMGQMPSPSEYIRLVNTSVSQGAIEVDYVEIAAPVYDNWPPKSHNLIFIESENRQNEGLYAREIIASFMERAWRRSLNSADIDQKVRLFSTIRPTCDHFEEAIVEVLSTVLASPEFLYVTRDVSESGELTAQQMATRLALFLWCSIPDAELRNLAEAGTLLEPEVLSQQVQRMLRDGRSKRLSEHFVHQWLDLQLLDFHSVPGHLQSLKRAMQREPIEVFQHILNTDASVLDFVHSDYTMSNERLAAHYGIAGVSGNRFRRVSLTGTEKRGGLLTQAGLLTMNSAGDDSHPLKRGVWLLESLLDDPPPPPPPAVPEIDLANPEIAKMTLKEQLEEHRNHPACMSCHAKIDPWGIALENYDALGRWRESIKGQPVDAISNLRNNQTLDGVDGLKRYLLEDRQDQFVRAMVHKLATYALGRPIVFADRSALDEICIRARRQGDGLATIIKLLVLSDLFRSSQLASR